MSVCVNEQPGPGDTEKAASSDNGPMKDVPLLNLMKDDEGHERTFRRYRVDFPMLAYPAAEENGLPIPAPESRPGGTPGLAHNVSLSGAGFLCGGFFEPGSLVEIEITLEDRTYSLLARIRWRRRLDLPGNPLCYYGAKFLRTEAVLQFIPVAAQFLLAQSSGRPVERERPAEPERPAERQRGMQFVMTPATVTVSPARQQV